MFLGYNDNIYTSKDLLHDLFFSYKTSYENGNLNDFNNLEHFFAFSYIRMKSLYWQYLQKKWKRSKREKNYFKELGYMYDKIDILKDVFDYGIDETDFLRNTSGIEIQNCINKIKNDEHRRILLLKKQNASHDAICNHFGYTKPQLRAKLHDARNKLFNILLQEGIISDEIKYNEFVGVTSKKGDLFKKLEEKHLYNDYPFESNYKDKILFIIKKNKGKIDLDFLHEVLKYNEGYNLKHDNRCAVNYALEKTLKDYSCFILDGVVYLKKI